MRDLNYQLKQRCHRNRDGSYATQAKRMHHLMLKSKESGRTAVGDDLGDLSGATLQSASHLCSPTVCHRVCIDGRGQGQYVQEISESGFILVDALSSLKTPMLSGPARNAWCGGIGQGAWLIASVELSNLSVWDRWKKRVWR